MKNVMKAYSLILALLVGACGDGQGINTNTSRPASTAGDLNANGVPDRFDVCPNYVGPVDWTPVSPDSVIVCSADADCLLNGDPSKLANGKMTPVASNKGVSSPVGVWCEAGICQMQRDTDLDGAGDVCEEDDDQDGIADDVDVCPLVKDPHQEDNDKDGNGDACDDDDDNDGIPDTTDNCPLVANSDQMDTDGDKKGDVCSGDDDGDTIPDTTDNCPLTKNQDQKDTDGDKLGDVCDLDDDNDGDPDLTDCKPLDPTIFVGQDELCDGKDNSCDGKTDEGFQDTDTDGEANCTDTDDDADGKPDTTDNCPLVANSDQKDTDGDKLGDLCDPDDDNDGVLDAQDNCPLNANANQADLDGDKQGDVCDGDCNGNGIPDSSPCTGDLDGDGYTPPQDCLEGNINIHPGATEACNGVDDDCDNATDENVTCPAGKICGGLHGCIADPSLPPGPECTQSSDCDDGDSCKTDACVAQKCDHAPKSCDDANVCTTDGCNPAADPAQACTHTAIAGCCNADAECADSDPTTVDKCQNHACTHAPACVPACSGKVCGADGCGGTCGTCSGTNVCDATGQCVPAPEAGTLKMTWAFAPESIPSTATEVRLMAECRDQIGEGKGTAVMPWGNKASSGKPYPASLSFTTVVAGVAWCKVNVVALGPGGSQIWQASCDGAGTCTGNGTMSASYFDGNVTYSATKLGTGDNGKGGINWLFMPGTDNDGDGKPNSSDPAPGDAST